MILKKVNIEVLDQVAKVAEILSIAQDQSSVKCNLYRTAKRIVSQALDLDGNVESSQVGGFEPMDLLAENRSYVKAEAKTLLGITLADYEVFWPPVVELTEEEIKALKIAELEKTIDDATTLLNELKG
jgi:hypothetical protein